MLQRLPMVKALLLVFVICTSVHAQAQSSELALPVSERDYLVDVPVILSVSRLSQTLDETPGAVTILDRHFIAQSGARDLADLLRFVPGFQTTTSYETDAPMATYHGRNDDWANRIQVLVDGRSVYSSHLQGSAGIGWKTLALDDIERVEVLRGSNSATYGARAFLGVVNIVSRDVRDTVGLAGAASRGENGIADMGVRLGWVAPGAAFRLSVDTTSDSGLRGAFGANRTERINLSSHLPLGGGREMDLRLGSVGVHAGRGDLSDTAGNAARQRFMGTQYVQLDWRNTISGSQDVVFSASHTEISSRDRFAYLTAGTYYLTPIDFSGHEYNDVVMVQHSLRPSAPVRMVWGAELRRERVVSPSSFDHVGGISSEFFRLFANAEWRLSERWLVNAGALGEHSDIAGDSLSSRLMVNWQIAEGHTLRAGVSSAFRPPSAFEKYGRVQYYDVNGNNPTGYYTLNSGQLRSEKLQSYELGYYLAWPARKVNADVRVFNEQVRDGIAHTELAQPGTLPEQYLNTENYDIRGLEYQVHWNPAPGASVFFNQSWSHVDVASSVGKTTQFRTENGAPRQASSLTWMHRLDNGVQLSLMHQHARDVALMSSSSTRALDSLSRTDMRLARSWILQGMRTELALTLQNLDAPYRDGDRKFYFDRRAWVTLKFEQ